MLKTLKIFPILLCGFVVIGCQSPSPSLYYWGNYSDSVYSYYDDETTLDTQQQNMLQIINNAQESGKQVGPGIYAHLGLISLKQGMAQKAQDYFQKEMTLYPESATFIQFLQRKNNSLKGAVK
ncbi:DUF4810 domain-containing protein [Pasteurella skyensis]|uniref:DUF4810 domain-containing protein n=1 Tax=Phocoenobacter skyensis TaxID=97481 RepID=A0AAJ6N8N3_9PAST|nr:DUF4810 domain-containing protein [Pasteurella skyensis]MDP8162420.1 DUF4810 domain-containing protein [Pasteurella skyensis]MDP8172246.1 DUF4810 domain-containing protein [Pasteurella skyensis]MDP8177120.1 DUF4810 domain-containing protein [Pasteurella skyensis]MDP8178501.1 DUF4810 domain-containing protein [Pasteurella skyensis]MDP8182503.1 DUF4810 domain-containing protein [Pasteurella skyensis]